MWAKAGPGKPKIFTEPKAGRFECEFCFTDKRKKNNAKKYYRNKKLKQQNNENNN